MSYSALASVAIVLALLAVAVALTAGVLVCVGRRRLAEKALPVFLGLLACAIVVTFAAVATSQNDLRSHTRRTLALASAAERAELSRTGRYTMSVFSLERVDRAFAADVKINQPIVRVTRGPGRGDVTLWVSLGPGTHAQATLHPDGRLVPVSARGARVPSRRRLVLATSERRPT